MPFLSDLDHYKIEAISPSEGSDVLHYEYISDATRGWRNKRVELRWTRQRSIGCGSYGDVWLETQTDDPGAMRAVKAVNKKRMVEISIDYTREMKALAEFSKPKYRQMGVFVDFLGWWENCDVVYLAMEYLPLGDLENYMKDQLEEKSIKEITIQTLQGLAIMHAEGFAHRDLKPANIFVVQKSPSWWVKIGDFGISKKVNGDHTAFRTLNGTQDYMAPEFFDYVEECEEETSNYTNAIDIWALGCIVYKLCSHTVPFPSNPNLRPLKRFSNRADPFPDGPLLSRVSIFTISFIRTLLVPEPSKRLTAKAALDFLQLNKDQTTQLEESTFITAGSEPIAPDPSSETPCSSDNLTQGSELARNLSHQGIATIELSSHGAASKTPDASTNTSQCSKSQSTSSIPCSLYDNYGCDTIGSTSRKTVQQISATAAKLLYGQKHLNAFFCPFPQCSVWAYTLQGLVNHELNHLDSYRLPFQCPIIDCSREGDDELEERSHILDHMRLHHKWRADGFSHMMHEVGQKMGAPEENCTHNTLRETRTIKLWSQQPGSIGRPASSLDQENCYEMQDLAMGSTTEGLDWFLQVQTARTRLSMTDPATRSWSRDSIASLDLETASSSYGNAVLNRRQDLHQAEMTIGHEEEIRCLCGNSEFPKSSLYNGQYAFLIQCDLCLLFQHACCVVGKARTWTIFGSEKYCCDGCRGAVCPPRNGPTSIFPETRDSMYTTARRERRKRRAQAREEGFIEAIIYPRFDLEDVQMKTTFDPQHDNAGDEKRENSADTALFAEKRAPNNSTRLLNGQKAWNISAERSSSRGKIANRVHEKSEAELEDINDQVQKNDSKGDTTNAENGASTDSTTSVDSISGEEYYEKLDAPTYIRRQSSRQNPANSAVHAGSSNASVDNEALLRMVEDAVRRLMVPGAKLIQSMEVKRRGERPPPYRRTNLACPPLIVDRNYRFDSKVGRILG